jgi:hypothetical protein
LDGSHITTDPYEQVRLASRSDVTVTPLVFGSAAYPAEQAVWTQEQIDAINAKVPELMAKMRPAPMAAPPADDEAVKILRSIRARCNEFERMAIDAYLAKHADHR